MPAWRKYYQLIKRCQDPPKTPPYISLAKHAKTAKEIVKLNSKIIRVLGFKGSSEYMTDDRNCQIPLTINFSQRRKDRREK